MLTGSVTYVRRRLRSRPSENQRFPSMVTFQSVDSVTWTVSLPSETSWSGITAPELTYPFRTYSEVTASARSCSSREWTSRPAHGAVTSARSAVEKTLLPATRTSPMNTRSPDDRWPGAGAGGADGKLRPGRSGETGGSNDSRGGRLSPGRWTIWAVAGLPTSRITTTSRTRIRSTSRPLRAPKARASASYHAIDGLPGTLPRSAPRKTFSLPAFS